MVQKFCGCETKILILRCVKSTDLSDESTILEYLIIVQKVKIYFLNTNYEKNYFLVDGDISRELYHG